MTKEDPAESLDTLPSGTQLGRYEIVRLMGRGGMGAVYEATHRDLRKRVAIKTLHPAVAALPGARARFLREGEAASRIQHPNVVDVTDVGTEGTVAYLVMEFLEGEDLAEMLARTGALPMSQSVDILLPVLGAIAAAHEEGVIHRDLKPENVFMARTRHGGSKPTVLDFGISKVSSRGGGNTLSLTGTGAAMGTPYYMAPEQVRSAAGVDASSDQYALGAILYECVTGRRAHHGETIYDLIRSVGEGSFTPPRVHRPEIPPALEEAILRAMRLEPIRRFPSVQAFGRAILPFASATARDHWAPAMAGGTGTDPRASSSRTNDPQIGGTVIMPPPPSGTKGTRISEARSGSAPRPDTTFGSSAAQITLPRQRRSGLLVGVVVLLAGGAGAAYLVTASTSHRRIAEPRPPGAERVAAPPAAAATEAPARYSFSVTASPSGAQFDLDGKVIGTGKIVQELSVDGAEHTLTVAASGFLPTRLTFRDRPPPEAVTLERMTPGDTAKVPASRAHGSTPSSRAHEPEGSRQRRHTPAAARAANGAAILDD